VFLLRLVGLLAVVTIGAALLAYIFSQDRRYLRFAWRLTRYALLFLFIFLALMLLERIMAPVFGL
jgi:hypothetical protein